MPFCYGMSHRQRYWSFEDQAGRPAVMIVAADAPPSSLDPLLEAFSAASARFAARGAEVLVLAAADAPAWASVSPPEGVEQIHCVDRTLFEACAAPSVLIVDRAVRLVERLDGRWPKTAVFEALAALDALPAEPARDVGSTAPVLIRPGVLDAETCRRLIDRFETGPHEAGAMASVDKDGAAVNRIDETKKHRRDLLLEPGEPLHAEVVAAISTRLAPDILRAFNVQVAHIDRILIARYDDTGGYFRRHRDNSSIHLAWREFALTLNLNTGDFEGGRLHFPEFDDHGYAPPAGAALVFSASLLHEAAPVTRGSRYVLLSFLHSDAAEARRQATLAQASV